MTDEHSLGKGETTTPPGQLDGCRRFALYVEKLAACAEASGHSQTWFVLSLARDCANFDLHRLRRPLHFWRSLREEPPVCFGPSGFRLEYVDDYHPARHYVAFLVVGYFLPRALALLFNRIWERVEGIVFGEYSSRDTALGRIGVEHGRLVRRGSRGLLCEQIQRSLCVTECGWRERVENDVLVVTGLDGLTDTTVLGIKPVTAAFDEHDA